jgi:fatty-acyl-CoA synthase
MWLSAGREELEMIRQPSRFVPDWLDKRARLTPDRVGLLEGLGGRAITFAAWNERANRTANFLRELGVDKGDRVAVLASNCPEYLDLFWAVAKIGAILHNLNWRLTTRELRTVVADGEPRVLCYSADWSDAAAELSTACETICAVVAFGPPRPGERSLAERDQHSGTLADPAELEFDDPWGIYYTGGTTGLPKGAILTHGNITWNSVNTIVSWGLEAGHAAALQLPFFHVGGPNIFMVPLVHVGGRTVLCRDFNLDETFALIASGAVTHYVGVPTMYQMIQADSRWESVDFSPLELVISGGAPCPLPIMEKFWQRGVDFKMGYGLTEASGNNFWLPPERVRDKPESVGVPLFHIDMRVVDDRGEERPADEVGELLIRGSHVMAGYWRNPEASAEAIRDGWLWTGDLAVRDDEGFFTIKGRSKDMFISGGENVYPAEVESVMLAYPGVAEAALVGVANEKWGEVGKACLVLEPSAEFSEEQFLEFLAGRLARYKLPKRVALIDELPKTAIGKVDKNRLALD